jgi:hypothetical protein
VQESFPLAAIGLAFLAGAALASADRLRVLSSPYPLWILLALNGGVAVVAGGAAFFVTEPDRPIDDDPSVVRVPKAEWEALLRRLEGASRAVRSRPVIPEWAEPIPPVPTLPRTRPPPAPALGPVSETPVIATPPSAPPEESLAAPSRTDLRREMGWLELQGFAESAVSTGERIGVPELRRLLEGSAEDLDRIADELGSPRDAGESSAHLLVRVLRVPPSVTGLPESRWKPPELERLAHRLEELLGIPTDAHSDSRLKSVTDEFESLLKELEASQTLPKSEASGPPSKAKDRPAKD